MEIYYPFEDERPDTFLDTQEVGRAQPMHLPRLLHPCGHEDNWLSACLPFDIPHDSVAGRSLYRPGGRADTVTPEQWALIAADIRNALKEAGRGPLTAWPGMRTGRLRARVRYRGAVPDFLLVAPWRLYSQRAVDAFRDAGLGGFEVFPAEIKWTPARSGSPAEYFEISPLGEATLAESAGLNIKRCPTCGRLLEGTYHSLVVDPASWNGGDFLRIRGFPGTYVSERVREVVHREQLTGFLFVPASRLGVGPGRRTLTEVLYEMKYERQMAARSESLRRNAEGRDQDPQPHQASSG